MKELSSITKALADESRIRILAALKLGELCVCQITELLQLAPSTVSKHLYLLKQAGLVDSRKDGRWIYYSLPRNDAPKIVRDWLGVLLRSAAEEKICSDDRKSLRAILKMDAEELCCRQRMKDE